MRTIVSFAAFTLLLLSNRLKFCTPTASLHLIALKHGFPSIPRLRLSTLTPTEDAAAHLSVKHKFLTFLPQHLPLNHTSF